MGTSLVTFDKDVGDLVFHFRVCVWYSSRNGDRKDIPKEISRATAPKVSGENFADPIANTKIFVLLQYISKSRSGPVSSFIIYDALNKFLHIHVRDF